MAGTNIVAGTPNIFLRSENATFPDLAVVGAATYKPCITENEELDGGGGFSQATSFSRVEVEVRDSAALQIKQFCRVCGDGVLSVRLVSGKTVVMRDPTIIGEVSGGSEGSITLNFSSIYEMEEVPA